MEDAVDDLHQFDTTLDGVKERKLLRALRRCRARS
jgi:hypothetical protein